MIQVIEVFGPTIQGEGEDIGKKCLFVRLAGCDYKCKWCDTEYAIHGSIPMTEHELVQQLTSLITPDHTGHGYTVVITGGNPCLQDLDYLIDVLHWEGFEVHIETQGSIWKSWLNKADKVNVSPKPPSSGVDVVPQDIIDNFIARLDGAYNIKVVIFDMKDFDFACELRDLDPEAQMILQIGNPNVGKIDKAQMLKDLQEFACELRDLDPEAQMILQISNPNVGKIDKAQMLKDLQELTELATSYHIFKSNTRILPQLHVLLWGNKRGV